MKRFNYYLGLILMLVIVTSCHEEFDQPPVYIPVADAVPNMTIAEFKAKHWQESANYVDTVVDDEVIHGWVTANDVSNNIYKTVYISDGTASLSISISQNELYKKFRIGQEIVLPMKGHYVGKATGQMNVAAPYLYVSKSGATTLECLNMSSEEMESLVQFNLLPNLSKVDTIDVNISDFQDKYDAETLRKYQGMLIRLKDVEFVDANGKATFADITSTNSATDRYILDSEGNRLLVRNSKSADFATNPLPLGRHDIVGVLGFYQTSSTMWQFYLRTIEDVMGEGKKGTKSYPFSVADAIGAQNTGTKGWIEGYIVGAVAPELTTVTSNADIEWKAPTTLDNTLVIADDPECVDYTKCIIVPLPQGSSFRSEANLKTHTNVYKTLLKVNGEFVPDLGMPGVISSGAKGDYALSVGYTQMHETFVNGKSDDWTEVRVTGNKDWFKDSGNEGLSVSGYNGTPPFDVWYISPALDIKNAVSKVLEFTSRTKCYGGKTSHLEVYILNSTDLDEATVKVQLDAILPKAPNTTGTWSSWTNSSEIDLSQWSDGNYYIGFRYWATADANNNYDTWAIKDVKFGMGDPPAPDNRADFETMGDPKGGQYTTFTSEKGWVATNSLLFQGGTSDSNPVFRFIGLMTGSTSTYAMAPTLNGKTSAVGTLVSPTLKGGMKKLTFNYGAAFSDKTLSFRVDVKQNGSVVKSWTVTKTDVVTKTAYTFEEVCVLNGDFVIEITNLSPSNSSSNKDRVSIWNLVWEQ